MADGEEAAAALAVQSGQSVQSVLLWSGRGLLLLLLLLGAAANAIALLAFCRGPGLRTLSNRFVMNLLLVNLVACASLLPLLLLDSLHGLHGLHGQDVHVLCAVSEGVAAGYCTASILGVLLIAVDQYYAVVDPLRYHSKVDAVRSAVMLAAAWLCALLAGALGALEPRGAGLWASCGTLRTDVTDVTVPTDSPDELLDGDDIGVSLYRQVYAGVFAVVVFVIPFAALCWIYVSISSAAHRNSQRTRRNGSGSVAPSTPPPELSCSECGTAGGASGRSLSTTPSSTLAGHARASAGSPYLPVSRSAPTMSATMDADLLPHDPHSVPSRRGSATSDEASCADSASACVTSTAVASVARTERRRSSCPHARPHAAHAAHTVTVTISPPTLAVRSASAWLVSSLRCRISNASLFRYREEGRAARVSAIVVVMALGCWAPYVAVLVLHAALPRHSAATPRHLDALALAALAAAVCISPCLFAFRNRRVQKEVRRMLCQWGRGRKGSLDRGCGMGPGKGRGRKGNGVHVGHVGGGSARRLLPHNLMASLAEDCSTPCDSTSALTVSSSSIGKGSSRGLNGPNSHVDDDASDASALTVSVSLLRTTPTPLWAPHLLPEDALTVETARSSFSSGASSSQGSALSTDTADE